MQGTELVVSDFVPQSMFSCFTCQPTFFEEDYHV